MTLGGVIIEVVEPGTRILSPDKTSALVVDERTCVQKGGTIFVTEAHWRGLMAASQPREVPAR